MKINKQFVVSINSHDTGLLEIQLENIKKFLKLDHIIILNCSVDVYNEIKNKSFKNVCINPIYFDKKRFDGSLFNGIYENLKLGLKNYDFKYHLTLSARSLFRTELTESNLNNVLKENRSYKPSLKTNTDVVCHWHTFSKSKFCKYIFDNKLKLKHEMHEGLIMTIDDAHKIKNFFDNNQELLTSICNSNVAMEEFVIPTLLFNWTGYTTPTGVWPGCENKAWAMKKIIYKLY